MRSLTCVLILILPILLTGGIHADGFMDTADGIFSGRERARQLEIMKDSRAGAFGVVSFVMLMFVQFALISDMHPLLFVPALFVMPIIGRLAMVLAIALFPYARPEGVGKTFADMADRRTVLIAAVTTAVFVLPWGVLAALSLLLGVLFALLLCRTITNILGGVTGDVYGAVTVLTETLVLWHQHIRTFGGYYGNYSKGTCVLWGVDRGRSRGNAVSRHCTDQHVCDGDGLGCVYGDTWTGNQGTGSTAADARSHR